MFNADQARTISRNVELQKKHSDKTDLILSRISGAAHAGLTNVKVIIEGNDLTAEDAQEIIEVLEQASFVATCEYIESRQQRIFTVSWN
jgi:hypothetical protein